MKNNQSDFTGRKLGAQEVMFYAADKFKPTHFALVADLEGTAPAAEWKKSLKALQERHPALLYNITEDQNGDLVFCQNPGCTLPFSLTELTGVFEWKGILEEELALPFFSAEAPLARVVILQSERENRTVLIFSAHHSIADALSVQFLINDLLSIMEGRSLEHLPNRPSADDLLGLTSGNNSAVMNTKTNPEADIPRFARARTQYLALPPSVTEELIKMAKAEQTSVHGALCAAAALAAAKILPGTADGTVNILSPVSSREAQQAGERCGLFMVSKNVNFDPANREFWELAGYAKNMLAGTSSPEYLAEFTKRVRSLYTQPQDIAQFMIKNASFDIMLSNLGKYPFPTDYGNLRLKYLHGPFVAAGFKDQQTIGALTINGQLCLTNCSRDLKPDFLPVMRDLIFSACSLDRD